MARKSTPADSMTYRGWVLVDYGRSKFASKGNVRRRVCRDIEPFGIAIEKFREVVDREEGGDV